MFTIISALLGFLGSGFPDLMKLIQDKQDKTHELEIMEKQIELQKLGLSQRLEEIQIQSEGQEMKALYEAVKTGITWVDALGATVRPVLAYAFIGIFMLSKLPVILMVGVDPFNLELIPYLWMESDACIFSSIIAFYFGSRHFHKMRSIDG